MGDGERRMAACRGGRPGWRREDGVRAGPAGMGWGYRGGVVKTGLRRDGPDRSGRAAGGTATERGDHRGRDAGTVRTPIRTSVAASAFEGKPERSTIVDGCRPFWQPPSRPDGRTGTATRCARSRQGRPGAGRRIARWAGKAWGSAESWPGSGGAPRHRLVRGTEPSGFFAPRAGGARPRGAPRPVVSRGARRGARRGGRRWRPRRR